MAWCGSAVAKHILQIHTSYVENYGNAGVNETERNHGRKSEASLPFQV